MKHILIGYGYTASYVANQLNNTGEEIEAYARQSKPAHQSNLTLICKDIINEGLTNQSEPFYLYYFISPPNHGSQDTYLKTFLQKSDLQFCKGITYISSSAVYGDQQNAWINEDNECHITTARQKRRLDAEEKISSFGQQHNIPVLILRCAGIYGQDRLPIDAARKGQPVIIENEAPATNLIYVGDLAKIITTLVIQKCSGIYNVADGKPKPMGYLQQIVAKMLDYPPATELPYEQVHQQSSEMKRFFMESSKRLLIDKLLSSMPQGFQFTQVSDAVQQILSLQGEH